MASIAKKLFSGASYQTINWLTTILISFFLTPFVISHLGNSNYGLWILVSSIFSFYGILDLGLSVATQRSITQALAVDDKSGANTAVITSLVVFLGIGVIALAITLAILLCGSFILEDKSLIPDYRIVVALLGTSISVIFPTYAVSGIYTANFRIDLSSRIHLAKFLIRSLLTYIALYFGYGILSLAIITAITDIGAAIVMIVVAAKLAPWLDWKFRYFERNKLTELFGFGSAFLFVSLCERGRSSLPSFAMNSSSGLEGVTYFGVAQQLFEYFTRLIGNIISVFQPLFVRQASMDMHEANGDDFTFVTEISFFASIVLGIGIIACARDFLSVWLSPEFTTSLPALYLLTICGIFILGSQPVQQIMFAYSQQREIAILSALEALLSAAIIFPATKEFGLIGAAASVSIPPLISKILIQPLVAKRMISINYKNYLFLLIKASLLVIVLSFVLTYANPYIPLPSYMKILVLGTASLCLSVTAALSIILSKNSRRRLCYHLKIFTDR